MIAWPRRHKSIAQDAAPIRRADESINDIDKEDRSEPLHDRSDLVSYRYKQYKREVRDRATGAQIW
jgi:hypothetical protein